MTDDLTERQRQVLSLMKSHKTPTEIAAVLGITSQGVHGHLRRLRKRGALPPSDRNGRTVARSPEEAWSALHESIEAQKAALLQRRDALKAEAEEHRAAINQLEAEARELGIAVDRLESLDTEIDVVAEAVA